MKKLFLLSKVYLNIIYKRYIVKIVRVIIIFRKKERIKIYDVLKNLFLSDRNLFDWFKYKKYSTKIAMFTSKTYKLLRDITEDDLQVKSVV